MSAMAPAYTTVQSSHSFSAPSPSPSETPKQKMEWPLPVKEYVRRSFEPDRQIPGISDAEINPKLREIITHAAESGQLLSIDWSRFPLPQQILHQEQMQRRQAFVPPPPYDYTNPLTHPSDSSPPFSRKRKIEDSTADSEASGPNTPPWRKNTADFEDRITYANKVQAGRMEKRIKKAQRSPNGVSSKFQEDLENRRRRFEQEKLSYVPHHSYVQDEPQSNGTLIGTCQTLEKSYFRLNRPPRAPEVRPQEVLEKTLDLLKKKWRQDGNYTYICDQFKSMRQDLTVQHIKNTFTIDVYELHARIALEMGDLGEYNQCQTQLRALYSLNLGGHPSEFLAYRILYFIHTQNRTGLNDILAELTSADKETQAVKHALETRSAIASGNYHRLFRLYLDVPNMGAYLMDMFVSRERLLALDKICKANKNTFVNIRFLTEELGFESHQETAQFLVDHGAGECLEDKDDSLVLNCSNAVPIFHEARQKAFSKVDIKGQI